MSKKLFTLVQALVLLGTAGQVFAGNQTYEVYERGRYVGTTTMPAERYAGMAGRLNATGLTLKAKVDPAEARARREAAERREQQWKRENEQRRIAAERKQEQWKRELERRREAAERREQQWKRENEQRRIAAQHRQELWKREFEQRHHAAQLQQQRLREDFARRHAAAQRGFQAWRMAR